MLPIVVAASPIPFSGLTGCSADRPRTFELPNPGICIAKFEKDEVILLRAIFGQESWAYVEELPFQVGAPCAPPPCCIAPSFRFASLVPEGVAVTIGTSISQSGRGMRHAAAPKVLMDSALDAISAALVVVDI